MNSWRSVKGAGMPVKSQKDARRGIGFGGTQGEGDDSDEEPDARRGQDGSQAVVLQGTHSGAIQTLRAASSPEHDGGWQADLAANAEEDKFRIGSVYDADAMALRNHQQQRVEATGEGPWLGSFDLASLPQEVHSELGAAQPWWEEDQEAHESTGKADSKRQRLMQKQLEAHVFERGHLLGPSIQSRGVD